MDLLVLTCFPYAGRIPCLLLRLWMRCSKEQSVRKDW
ncbi:hypothetical protein PVAP13_2NG300506 [Panicum virgatum]|uniref:Uncharacterized protein n=1 Tax=Panicum virgatum TaxID=38727 RepID=A0A8T0VMG0_PANVG|nr:hypothetical protein PVAP13_2NG300506 [Panicum virgatum]